MKYVTNSFDEPARVVRRPGVPEDMMAPLDLRGYIAFFFSSRFGKEGRRRFAENNLPMEKDSGGEKLRKAVRIIAFVLLFISVGYIIFYYFGYRGRISENLTWEEAINTYDNLPAYESERLWQEVREQYPAIDFPAGMSLKFAKMYAVNSDVSGWLKVPNTNISTVLLQNPSNNYYLRRDIYGKYSRYGNPYFDARCRVGKDGLSQNTIVYGHNTHDGLMFHQLTEYMTLKGYKKAPVVTVDTLYEKTQWKIFAVILTNSTSDADNGRVFQYLYPEFDSKADFERMLDGIMLRSMIRTGIDVNADDKILTLYTCYQNIFAGGRLVVFARLVRPGENPEVDTSNAYFNAKARYPQAYYDAKGLDNPYVNG